MAYAIYFLLEKELFMAMAEKGIREREEGEVRERGEGEGYERERRMRKGKG